MRRQSSVLWIVLGFFAAVPAVAGAADPSFDCAKAESSAEKLVCTDSELAALDVSLAQLYARVLEHTPAGDQKMLKAE